MNYFSSIPIKVCPVNVSYCCQNFSCFVQFNINYISVKSSLPNALMYYIEGSRQGRCAGSQPTTALERNKLQYD